MGTPEASEQKKKRKEKKLQKETDVGLPVTWFIHLELETLARLLSYQNILEPTLEK